MSRSETESLQQRLRQVEASHARFLRLLPGMVYRCIVKGNYEYTLVFASEGCEQLLGLIQEAIIRNPTNTVELLTREEDLAGMRRSIHEALLAGRGYEVQYRLRLTSGEEKWIRDRGEGVFDENGRCVFLEGIMMDVTAQKIRETNLKRENRTLRPAAPEPGGLGKIVGNSRAMREVYDLLRKAAKSDINVVLYGETGVGKDLAAKTIHELSGLKGRYIPVNCAAIPEQLLESEFFGHVKGAFSGATTNRMGYLAAADKGTLFLDEIAELPLHLQAKLLRALESKTYTPVGSNEARSSNFRLISATNRDLAGMVRQKSLRADFFYRIHMLAIVLPPLRERTGDIPLLVEDYARRKGIAQKLPAAILASFESGYWPGNVRELQNTLERYWSFGQAGIAMGHVYPDIFALPVRPGGTAGMSPHGDPARVFPPQSAVFPELPGERRPETAEAAPAAVSSPFGPARQDLSISGSLSAARDDLEKRRILSALERYGWKKGKTADALGITMRTLQRKLKKYALRRLVPSV